MLATPVSLDVPIWTDEHGRVRVRGTRVLLELLIHAYHAGESAEGIVDMYPTLALSDVYGVLAYYLVNRASVDSYIAESDATSDAIQRQIEANYDANTLALRARLQAHRDQQ